MTHMFKKQHKNCGFILFVFLSGLEWVLRISSLDGAQNSGHKPQTTFVKQLLGLKLD